ncbi:MAG: nitric oxide synthase oxygenase [Angustibacter sp.]
MLPGTHTSCPHQTSRPFAPRPAADSRQPRGLATAPTAADLERAAKEAWRLAERCIGRLYWNSLNVFDRRGVTEPADVFDVLVEHLRFSTNGGQVRPAVTVLDPGVRVLNDQLIGYAGYQSAGTAVVGDPKNVELTNQALALGWPGGRPDTSSTRIRSRWDTLPLLVRTPSGVSVHELPEDVVLQVPIVHPEHPEISRLGLRWYAVPAISDMPLQVAAGPTPSTEPIELPCVFGGWYLSTEIAHRDLCDPDRYDQLPAVADALGLDTSTPRTLWRARAVHELHVAVVFSFDRAGARLSDPEQESEMYLRHCDRERRAGRSVPEDWSWIVPPYYPTTVYHRYGDQATPTAFPRYRPREDAPAQVDQHRLA